MGVGNTGDLSLSFCEGVGSAALALWRICLYQDSFRCIIDYLNHRRSVKTIFYRVGSMNTQRESKFLAVFDVLSLLATIPSSAAIKTSMRAATMYSSISASFTHACALTQVAGSSAS